MLVGVHDEAFVEVTFVLVGVRALALVKAPVVLDRAVVNGQIGLGQVRPSLAIPR